MNKILVIEDEQNIHFQLLNLLSSCGYTTCSAFTGSEGFKKASTTSFDAIILDNMLPKLNGLSLCKKIREKHITTPILIITASSDISCKTEFLYSGADDFICKPFHSNDVICRLKSILKRSTTYFPSLLIANDIQVDSIHQKVYRGKKEIKLTHKEYAILTFMIKYKNLILSRETLFNHIWNKNADPFSNTLEAHILSLRKKLGFKRNQFIKSISGQGYMLTTNLQ